MYIYFDRTGTIKEIINDDALRQSSDNYNKIYCYFEGISLLTNEFWFKYKLSDESILPLTQTTTKITKEIPFNNKRDLRYFKYNKDYTFIEIPTSFIAGGITYNVLSLSGLVECSIKVINSTSIIANGLIVFNVEAGVEENKEIQAEEYISLAQFNYLMENVSTRIQKVDLTGSEKLTDLAGNPQIIKYSNEYYLADIYDGNFSLYQLNSNVKYSGTYNATLTLGEAITTEYRKTYIFKDYLENNYYEKTDVYNKTETDTNFLKIVDATPSTLLNDLKGNPKILKMTSGIYIARIRVVTGGQSLYNYYYEIENLVDKTRYADSILFTADILTLGDVMVNESRKDYLDLSYYTNDNKSYLVTVINNAARKIENPISFDGDNSLDIDAGSRFFLKIKVDTATYSFSDDGYISGDGYDFISERDVDYYVTNWNANNIECVVGGTPGAYYYYYQFAANGVYKLELDLNRDTTTRYELGIVQIESLSNTYILYCGTLKAQITPNQNEIRIFDDGVEFDDNDYTEDCGLHIKKIK